MTLLALLFSIGILFLVVEVLIPGGILGALGVLCMLAGSVFAFNEYGTGGGILSLFAALGLGGLVVFLELYLLPRTRVGRRAFLTSEVTGVSAAFDATALQLVGKSAEALTMLSPSGYVDVEGERYEAFCQSGQVPAGTPLEIIGADNFRLIVTLKPN